MTKPDKTDSQPDYPWPVNLDADPADYEMRLLAWSRRHRDCGGHYCRHDEGRPCPTPPAVPKFTTCPEVSIANPRLMDCGGCEGCMAWTPTTTGPADHRCHLTGIVNNCRGSGPAPDHAITAWADYELIAAVDLRSRLEAE